MENQEWVYSDKVKDHFMNPRNFLFGDESQFDYDAVGTVGNPVCGDQMKMYIKVEDNNLRLYHTTLCLSTFKRRTTGHRQPCGSM